MKVMFVCAGNICRSPIAETLFRREAAFHASLLDVEVASAGVVASDGAPATAAAVQVAREDYGADLTRHSARTLATAGPADLVLAVDRWVLQQLEQAGLGGRVALLGDYAGFPGEEVVDPYDQPVEHYQATARQIARLVRALASRLGTERAGLDLDAYLARIGWTAGATRSLATLRGVHAAHVAAIPFENLDVQMDRPIRLDLASLQGKLVQRLRGGYCFEQNTLFLHALRAIGFDVIACEARVRVDGGRVLPRTHMVLLATIEDASWLCDVGFGGDGPLEPVRLDGHPSRQSLWTYRVEREGSERLLQMRRGEAWVDLYAFVPEPRYPVDFEMANWFTSTWPSSAFVTKLTAQRSTSGARTVLRDLTLSVTDASGTLTRQVPRAALTAVLRDTFNIHVHMDARFRIDD